MHMRGLQKYCGHRWGRVPPILRHRSSLVSDQDSRYPKKKIDISHCSSVTFRLIAGSFYYLMVNYLMQLGVV